MMHADKVLHCFFIALTQLYVGSVCLWLVYFETRMRRDSLSRDSDGGWRPGGR